MDSPSSTPAGSPVPPEVSPEDEKKVFLDSMLQNSSDSSKYATAPETQKAYLEAEARIVQEHLKGETTDNSQSQNSMWCSENAFSRSSISSDVDNETYYSLESDREKAISPSDSWDDGEDFEEVHDQIGEDDSDIGFPEEFFTQRDVVTVEGFQPGDISHEDTLIGSSSSAESLTGWEEVHQPPLNILMSKTAYAPTGPTHQVEIAQADESTAGLEMEVSSNSDSEPVDLTIKKSKLYFPSAQVVISSSQDHLQLSGGAEEQAEHHLSPTIDSGDSEEDSPKLGGKKLGDEKPSFSGENSEDSEAEQPITMRFFEITNLAATSGGVCQEQELMIQTYPQENAPRLGKMSVAEAMAEEAQTNVENTFEEEEEEIEVILNKEQLTDESMSKATAKVAHEDTGSPVVSPETPKSEGKEIIEIDASQTARIRDKVEETLQKTGDPATQNSESDPEEGVIEKSVPKRVSFSTVKSQKSIFHTQPTFPLTALHKWPADMSPKRTNTKAEEMQIVEEGPLNADGEIHDFLDIDLTPDQTTGITNMATDGGNGLSLALGDDGEHFIGPSHTKNIEGIDNPTFVMDGSNIKEGQVDITIEETPLGKPSSMRSLIKEMYLPRLKPKDHLLLRYPDPVEPEITVTDGKHAKVEESADHIAISIYDNQGQSGSNPIAITKSSAPWWNEYFGYTCVLVSIIAVIILCVVLRTYFPLHNARQLSPP